MELGGFFFEHDQFEIISNIHSRRDVEQAVGYINLELRREVWIRAVLWGVF